MTLRVSLTSALLRRPAAQILLVAVAHSCVVTASSIWVVDIDNGPAPSPQDGPPLSAHASRDMSLLKYQVIGIVGAYVATVLVIGLVMLVYGRHKRLAALAIRSGAVTEMMRPTRWVKPSPVSPGSPGARSWKSWGRPSPSARQSKHSFAQSVVSSVVDQNVLEADKAKREEEMERLYAAVLKDDSRKTPDMAAQEFRRQEDMTPLNHSSVEVPDERQGRQAEGDFVGVQEIDPVTGQVLSHRRNPSTSSRSFSQRRPPPRVDTASVDSTSQHQHSATSQRAHQGWETPSQRSHEHQADWPPARNPPSRTTTPQDRAVQTFPVSQALPESSYSPERARSRPRAAPSASATQKLRKSQHAPKQLTISAPVQHRYPSTGPDDQDESRPLSPRQYSPGPPPSPPTRASTTSPMHSAPVRDDGDAQDEDIIYAYGYEGLDSRRPIPHAAPHRGRSGPPPASTASTYSLPSSPRAFHTSPPLPPLQTNTTIQQRINDPLPLRNYPSATPTSPTKPSKTLPTPTKTTFLSPTAAHFPHQGPLTGKTPGGLPAGWTALSPRTRAAVAGPATPYSPYMPRTPMTPVTPRLVTRAERRARRREVRGAIGEEEEVRDDGEVWGDGY